MTTSIFWKDDPAYLLNAAFLNKMFEAEIPDGYLSANSAGDGVTIAAEVILKLKSGSTYKAYKVSAAEDITTLDTGSLSIGNDYYVYLCDDATDSGTYLISLNNSAPSGYTTSDSVCIGGFHYGRVRKVDSSGFPLDSGTTVYGSGWETQITTEVVPNSVWDDFNRPLCDPQGMAKVGKIWVDIYQTSEGSTITVTSTKLYAGSAESTYNDVPLTGTESISFYVFNELAEKANKRLLTYDEWLECAEGSPDGQDNNTYAYTASSNSARNNTGQVVNAVSASNICDCVGNVYEFVNSNGIVCMGGAWDDSTNATQRYEIVTILPTDTNTKVGCRFCCNSKR
jgi:hypothetical protein